jgi:tetratricopeptide (TPR) repeat protein
MRRHNAVIALVLASASLAATAQTAPQAAASSPAAAAAPADQSPASGASSVSGAASETNASPSTTASSSTTANSSTSPSSLKPKLDALLLYRQGRDLETAGSQGEAQGKYAQAVSVCNQELSADPSRIEAYVVKSWCLFRLGKYSDVIATGQAGMKVSFDARLSEVMGEAYYFLGQMDDCLTSLQKYLEIAGDSGDRGPTALFFMGEAYLRLKKYAHADIAYSTAVLKEPSMSRWWFRLGNACEANEDWKRAFDAYGKALALNPGYPDALAAQARVKAKVPQ